MNRKFAKRLLRTFILSAAALVIGMVLAYNQIKSQVNEETNDNGRTHSLVSSVKLGGDFTLVDHNGRRVTQDIFNDHYVLLYFGFTYCPAICPTELQKISAVLKRFEETDPELLEKILPVFITIDPERDTPAVLKEYLSLFNPRILGLSGTESQIKHVKNLYRIYAKKVQTDEMTEYTMDHSSYIYLFDKKGKILSMFRMKDDKEAIYKEIDSHIR